VVPVLESTVVLAVAKSEFNVVKAESTLVGVLTTSPILSTGVVAGGGVAPAEVGTHEAGVAFRIVAETLFKTSAVAATHCRTVVPVAVVAVANTHFV